MILDINHIRERIVNLKTSHEELMCIPGKLTPASVLIPLYEKDGITHILFTKRTEKVSHHKGQISFPGGKVDKEDHDLQYTALRETFEEVGISPTDVTVLGKINNMITITNFQVTPFVGTIPYPYTFTVNPDEIAELIEVPVSHLLDKNYFREETREIHGKTFPMYYYHFQNHVIWGVTGKILYDFLALLNV